MTTARFVVPCYNEEQRLQPEKFIAFLAENPDFAFTFVDDGSGDGTFALLQRLQQAAPEGRVAVLQLDHNRGKGEAVRQGMLSAMGCVSVLSDSVSPDSVSPDYVGYCDADLATPLDELPRLLAMAQSQPQALLFAGARVKLLGKDIQRKLHRHYLGRVFATAASCVLGLPVYDTQCGLKLFRYQEDLPKLFRRPFVSRWIFDVEIFARYVAMLVGRGEAKANMGRFLQEYSLQRWQDIGGSKLTSKAFLVAAADLARIWLLYRWRPQG